MNLSSFLIVFVCLFEDDSGAHPNVALKFLNNIEPW